MQQRHLQLATFPFVIARFRRGPKAALDIPLQGDGTVSDITVIAFPRF